MWNYDPAKYDPYATFVPIPEGKHRLRISDAEIVTSKNGKEMIKVTFRVKDHTSRLFTYFVNGDNFQASIDPFFGSFGIEPATALDDISKWIGLLGAADVEHQEYQGKTQARIKEFIQRGDIQSKKSAAYLAPAPLPDDDYGLSLEQADPVDVPF